MLKPIKSTFLKMDIGMFKPFHISDKNYSKAVGIRQGFVEWINGILHTNKT